MHTTPTNKLLCVPTSIQYTTRPIQCTNDCGPLTISVIEPMTLNEHSFRVLLIWIYFLVGSVHTTYLDVCNNNLVNPTKIVNTRYPL